MAETQTPDAETDELVSHVLALRKDFVQQLLREHGIPYSGRKGQLRQRLVGGIEDGTVTLARVAAFLDEVEPGGKQHVFLLRARKALNDGWRDPAAVHERLQRRKAVHGLLDAPTPLLMPSELTLSRVLVQDGLVEITAVEARRYLERDESYDREARTEEGLPIVLKAHVERVARSTVLLRWDTGTRHAALHVTQASGRGLSRNHYREVYERFAAAVEPWLALTDFRELDLRKAVHALQLRERAGDALTRSRRARFETDDGAEIEAVSASTGSGIYSDSQATRAVGQVEGPASGYSGNFYWLGAAGTPLDEDLHVSILAFDARVHFMVPSTPEAVEHVLGQIRSLL